jgi:CheY-like chemotaxis protein
MDVLVVDPTELGELLVVLLQQHGHAAGHVRTAERALEAALADTPHVVVIEAELPDAVGLDLAEILREELSCKIVLTHEPRLRSDPAWLARAQLCERLFPRPYTAVELLRAVAALLGRDVPTLAPEPANDRSDDGDVVLIDEADGGAEIDFDDALGDDIMAGAESLAIAPEMTAPPVGLDALQNAFASLRASGRALPVEPPSSVGVLQPRVLFELLNAFHQAALHGELRVDHAGVRRALVFRSGRLCGARSSAVADDLIKLLLDRKAIDEENALAVMEAVRTQAFRSIPEAIIAFDAVPELALHAVLEEHTRKIALAVSCAAGGRFQASVSANLTTHDGIDVQLHIGDVLLHLFLRGESDDALRIAAPDDVRFQPLADAAYGLEQLRLSPQEARVVVAMDGSKTIADLRLLFEATQERTIRGLAAALHTLGLVRVAGRGAAMPKRISFF